MNQYSRLYTDLQDIIKILGGKFRHTTSVKDSGTFRSDKKQIYVSNKSKNTLIGCYVLSHELGHFADCLMGRFKKWYNGEFEKTKTWISPPLIKKLEKSANDFAIKMLRQRKLSIKNIPHLNKRAFEGWLIPYWTLKYNGLCVKNFDGEIIKLYEEAKIPYYWASR